MIYYPLSVLMLAGIRDILIISTDGDLDLFKNILGDGSNLGINLQYKIQHQPKGIADAFIIGRDFIGKSRVSLILGDNIFFGFQFSDILEKASRLKNGALILTTFVNNPEEYGVAELDEKGTLISIEEKPSQAKSNLAITGLYFYDNSVIDIVKKIKPSKRGELEITDLNKEYMKINSLEVLQLGRGFAWLDTGTHSSLLEAGEFVRTIEKRQGLKIACLEEIAFNSNWIDSNKVISQIDKYKNSPYGDYLKKLIT